MKQITFDVWAEALRMTENPHDTPILGDAGRAAGPWQMHPDFIDDYYPDGEVFVGMTWAQFFRLCLKEFWWKRVRLDHIDPQTATDLAMKFHLGITAFQRGDRDDAYRNRFEENLSEIITAREN